MKRKDYAFRRQFNEKPSIIPGCPGIKRYLILTLARPTVPLVASSLQRIFAIVLQVSPFLDDVV